MTLYVLAFLFANILAAIGGRPEVKCPAPISPLNGKIFIMKSGTAVKYICNSGFELQGAQIAFCKKGQWHPETPSCVASESNSDETEASMPPLPTTSRPLFKWDDENNDTKNENDTMQGDDSRVVYVRRWPYYYYRAPLHQVTTAEDSAQAQEDTLRYYYYWNGQYPRSALADYRALGLSESQWAWINSLHPETRDKYLRDLHKMGYIDPNYLNYVDNYNWVPRDPYYVRRPVAVVAESPVATLDYSCHRTERDGRVITIKAPKLPNAYIYRYDRRQNPNYPRNDYLAAQYRCRAGYTLLDPKLNELYCSRSSWVGHKPVCVPHI